MKLKFITAALVMTGFFLSKESQAQHLAIYGHALYATPLDKSSQNLYKTGVGGVAGITVGENNTRFVASIGYTGFSSENDANNPHNFGDETYVPVKIGIQQHLPLILSFLYLQADAGAGFISYKSNSDNDTRFAFDIGAGAKFGIFEAALVWDSFTEKLPEGWSSWLTIQAGLKFGF